MGGSRSVIATLVAVSVLLAPTRTAGMCNFIPSTVRSFASTAGAIDRPYSSPERLVRVTLGRCDDPSHTFAADSTVSITFAPPHGSAHTVDLPTEAIFTQTERSLVFLFPESRNASGDTRTGPATIEIRTDGRIVARIDALGERDAGCAFRPDPTFPGFTALPAPNDFHDVASGSAEPIEAAIDTAGNLLLPFDWTDVFPAGNGFDPVARFVSAGQSSLEAFPAPDPRAGRGIVLPDAAYVSSHTTTGSILPPLLEVGPTEGSGPFPGTTVAGTVDSLDGVLRFARQLGDDASTEVFDLSTRLEDGTGPIFITERVAREGPLLDLRTLRSSTHVIGFQGAFSHGERGLFVFDTRSGALGRIAPSTDPRKFALSDDLLAFHRDRSQSPLRVYELEDLTPGSDTVQIPLAGTTATSLSADSSSEPTVGTDAVGTSQQGFDVFYDLAAARPAGGRLVGGRDLVELPDGIRHRGTDVFTPYDGALAPLAPGTPGRVFAVGNRAVFAVCRGICQPEDDRVLMLLDDDGTVRELARNVGSPFVFTGRLVGLVFHEDAAFGAAASAAADVNDDDRLDATVLRLYDLEHDRLLTPVGPDSTPLAVPARDIEVAATRSVIVLVAEEADAGSLTCDADTDDRVALLVNGETGRLVNTRQPVTVPRGSLTLARGLLSFLQPEDRFGRPLGDLFLHVERDSDGDEIPDPHDNCPLTPNLDQANGDGVGPGDACASVTVSVDAATARSLRRADRACIRRVDQAVRHLLRTTLRANMLCPTCAVAIPPNAARRATSILGRCNADALARLPLCGRTPTTLIGPEGSGCLAAAIRAAVADAAIGTTVDGAAGCARSAARILARYGQRRHQLLARCERRNATATAERPVTTSCALDPVVAPRLSRLEQVVRRQLARRCEAAELAALGVCSAPPQGASGTADPTECMLETYARSIDHVVGAQHGRRSTAVGFEEAPCPPVPAPEPTATPLPGTILVRFEEESPSGEPSELDVGWTGFGHGGRMAAGTEILADLECERNESTCIVTSSDLTGTSFSAPLPLTAGGVSVCITLEYENEIAGAFDTDTGALHLDAALAGEIFTGISLAHPCPACVPIDGVPDVGDVGQCSFGPASGAPCIVDSVGGREFTGNAGTSRDCPPFGGAIGRFRLDTVASTSRTEFTTSPASPRCMALGYTNVACPCSTCDTDAEIGCRSDADCPARDGQPGTCGGLRCLGGPVQGQPCDAFGLEGCQGSVCGLPGEPTRPNGCIDQTCVPTDDGGRCANAGPFLLRCEIERFRFCAWDPDCPLPGDRCVAEAQRCFPDRIVSLGSADVSTPTIAGQFCLPPAAASAVNSAVGLPGPAVYRVPASVAFRR